MSKMCNACDDEQKVLGHGVDCKGCSTSFCAGFDKRGFTLATDVEHAKDQHSTTELISKISNPTCSCPAHLLLDAPSSAADCGNSISEMNSHSRENGDEAVDIHLEQSKRSNKDEVTGSKISLEILSATTSDCTTGLDRVEEATFSGETLRSRTSSLEIEENGKDERFHLVNNTQGDLRSESLRTGDDLDKVDNGVTSTSLALSFLRKDPLIWKPPEAANIEDDLDSVANNDDDDDDDYTDGTKWGQSTSLGDFDKIHGNRYKEVRQKAMVAAMNGQFKILVSRFLASEGLASMGESHGTGWLDIVTALSWEAALFIKPDAKEGRAMDPGSYVKVKCAATGTHDQSKVIKGLIFKKNAAHKHMPIKFKNPRLLLIKGVLGQRELGLSSFDSMDQEKDYLKSINEMIEACHPNLVLVERSVSRDIQEFLLAKGMTLVYDMKIARLERIARCTGSQIIPSANILTNRNITQCDSFHIEKLTEEHNNFTEVGKRTIKTLMFLEGFSKPLGCTILLKGAHIDELKRVKRVLQYTIFAAYHLILETSFFADQRALFSSIDSSEGNDTLSDKAVPTIPAPNSKFSDSSASNSFLENSAHEGVFTTHLHARSSDYGVFTGDINFCEDNFTQDHPRSLSNENVVNQSSLLSSSDHSMHLMPSFVASYGRLASDKFSPFSSESISSYCDFKDQEHDYSSLNDVPIDSSYGNIVNIEANENIMEEKPNNERPETFSVSIEPVQYSTAVTTNKIEIEGKDDSDGVLSSESILVLLSSQCIEKGLVCEQSHLSRIKYYGNFDVSLGRYLQDVLLNQKHSCSSCGESPDAHIYCYTHQNGNLTVLVKQIPSTSSLSGGTEGKIWMWSRCLKCEHENGIPRSTKRVVMSTAARSLSFGKFLELSFTSHSAASRLSSECGHSLHRDCLRFFGLGSKVAMFRYSPVEIYAACKPPPVLEFTVPGGQEWIMQEANSVLQRGEIFFSEVANFLNNLKISSRPPSEEYKNFPGFVKSISEAEDMLTKEKAEFKSALLKAINCAGAIEKFVSEIIGLNWFNQELLLGLYIWDRRLHQLSQISKDFDRSRDENERFMGKVNIEIGDTVSGAPNHIPITVQRSTSASSYDDQNHYYPETDAPCNFSKTSQCSGSDEMECSIEVASFDQSIAENVPNTISQNALSSSPYDSSTKDYEEECSTVFNPTHEVQSMEPSVRDISDLEMMNDSTINGIGLFFDSTLNRQQSSGRVSPVPDFEDPESLIWVPFNELRIAFKNDLDGGYLHKFSFIRTYTPKYLSPMHQLYTQERGLLHYPVGTGRKVMSACEDEISSIIACALALSEDQNCLLESVDFMKNSFEGKMEADKEIDNPSNLSAEGSMTSFYWSSNNGSLESFGMPFSRSFSSLSLDESSSFAGESAASTDRLITTENLHPEVPLGIRKEGFKKYSVVCIHAKQFYALRRMCCPSEQAYIYSLSRCRKWDAQGGKSNAFFAKSMDDRFIIKQIKRAELDSFLKFAPDYFKHITHSLSTGSQTCLAKILGIYQVRLTKSGKEVKIDLMVMENLLFGHNVSRTYDLKGAVFSRYISDINDSEKVLLDQNFVEDMRSSPIYIGGKTKHLLQRAIWNDTSFLSAINVMDYSLLVGVDKKEQQLVFGIIDYLRQYTWDKQLETWVKASLVVPKNSLPTIISPKEYKKRFRKFMSRYFLTVPDSWCSTECSESCKFCTGGSNSLSGSHGLEPSQREV